MVNPGDMRIEVGIDGCTGGFGYPNERSAKAPRESPRRR
jgi:hypothetical protein